MKKLSITIIAGVLLQLDALAQAPWWYRNTPISSSGEYCYVGVSVRKGEDDLKMAAEKARSCLGVGLSPFQADPNDPAKVSFGGSSFRFARVDSKHRGTTEYVLMSFTKSDIRSGDINNLRKVERDFKHPFKNPIYVTLPLSMVLPGSGQLIKKQKGKGVLLMSAFLLSAGAGAYFEYDRSTYYDKFHEAPTFDERESHLDQIEQSRSLRNIALGTAGVFYIMNVIDVLSSKSRRLAHNQKDHRINWGMAYNPNLNTGNVGMSFKF